MKSAEKTDIGAYLKDLIEKKYGPHRKFCKAYLIVIGIDPNDEELRKMGNRLSQILKGIKGVQITDLPVFAELLDVSCEEILSAGQYHAASTGHVTNYSVALSDDPLVWKAYVNREDKLILNADEYGKTILDYIFEFKNYGLLQYLLKERLIWFVDREGCNGYTYGAGTCIEGRRQIMTDTAMPIQIMNEDSLRLQAVALAIEKKDSSVLDEFHSREAPWMHQATGYFCNVDLDKYYNRDLVYAIANADETILDYFSREFVVVNTLKVENTFIFPYIGKVVDIMLQRKRKEAELLIRRMLAHNKWVYEVMADMLKEACKVACEPVEQIKQAYIGLPDKKFGEQIQQWRHDRRQIILDGYQFSEHRDLVTYNDRTGIRPKDNFISDIIRITATSKDPLLSDLIMESNDWYDKIINLKETAHE